MPGTTPALSLGLLDIICQKEKLGHSQVGSIGSKTKFTRKILRLRLDTGQRAGTQLDSIDPERANAALWGLRYDLTTQEILSWRSRILQKSGLGPASRDMTTAQLVDCFVDACERCYGSTRFLTEEEGGWPTMKAYNKISLDFYGAAKELNPRGELGALVPLLDHPLITVRVWAARYCLPIATEQAIATLDQVATTCDCVERSDALKTLASWRSGQYRLFAY